MLARSELRRVRLGCRSGEGVARSATAGERTSMMLMEHSVALSYGCNRDSALTGSFVVVRLLDAVPDDTWRRQHDLCRTRSKLLNPRISCRRGFLLGGVHIISACRPGSVTSLRRQALVRGPDDLQPSGAERDAYN
jgi:hypothetical protein